MKEILRSGNLPPPLIPLLEQGEAVVKTMAKMSKEDIPVKGPRIYECSSVEEVMAKTAEESGQPQVIRDIDNERVYIVGLGFGRRFTSESIETPDQEPIEEWRTIIFFSEMSDAQWMEWRRNWNKEKEAWMEDEIAKRDALAETRKRLKDKEPKFKKTYEDPDEH